MSTGLRLEELVHALNSLSDMASPERWLQLREPLLELMRARDTEIASLKAEKETAWAEVAKLLAFADRLETEREGMRTTLVTVNDRLSNYLRKFPEHDQADLEIWEVSQLLQAAIEPKKKEGE